MCDVRNCRKPSTMNYMPANMRLCDDCWDDYCNGKLDIRSGIRKEPGDKETQTTLEGMKN